MKNGLAFILIHLLPVNLTLFTHISTQQYPRVAFNWGIGHADIMGLDCITYLYTATSQETRGRYRLEWKTTP